ncbi:MAG: MG2 domain-containing protein, partial [Bacteroidota bacterium]|nr:MG2 domain-containing protein [Candidatus Kapabacteria bacterium]MDW8220386.1 MG2 domain-containing protein [Bacteroidota bacterium]
MRCSSGNDLVIANKNFDEQVDLHQNLILEFSHPLVADSLLNTWDTTAYIKFTPHVKGSFKWTSPTTLVFSPLSGFRPSTDYTAELTEALLYHAAKREKKRVSLPAERSIHFHTPYLALNSADAVWVRTNGISAGAGTSGNAASVELRLDIAFNYTVAPEALREHLQLLLDGKTLPFVLKTMQPAHTLTLGIQCRKEDGGKQLTLTLTRGLRCVESEWKTPNDIQQTLAVPLSNEFKITAITTDYDDDNPIIRIHTSQSLFDSDVRSFVKVQPQPRNFAVEATETGIIVRGAFQPDSSYQVTVSKDLRGLFGSELGSDVVQTVNFGTLVPTIKFADPTAMYLSTLGAKNIAVQISSVPRVELTIEKVYENNLLAFYRLGKTYNDEYDSMTDEYSSWQDYASIDEYGDPVLRKIIDTKTLPKAQGRYVLHLDFHDKLPGKGLYVVRVVSTEHKWLRDSRLIAVSDIGLLAKLSTDALFVAVHSLKTTEPIPSAEIRVISRHNQVIAKGETNKEGIVTLSNLRPTTPGSSPAIIAATANGETTYLMLDNTKVETSRFDVGGIQDTPAGLQAYIYGERNIYRPGETVRFNVIVRDATWSPAAQQPIKIKIVLPTGKDYTVLKRTLNDEGAVETSLAMPTSAMTGNYTIEVYTMNDVLLASERFNLEEFLPDRISVTMGLSSEVVRPGGTVQIT